MAAARLKRKKGGKRARLTGFLFILLMILYIPAMWKWFFTKPMNTGIIQEDTLELKVPATGVFIRNETVLSAEDNGSILPIAQYGERVPTGGTIASFVGKSEEDIVTQYQNEENALLLRILDNAKTAGNARLETVNKAVDDKIISLAAAAGKGELQKVSDIRAGLDFLLEERARNLVAALERNKTQSPELQDLQKLKNRVTKLLTPVRTDIPGIVCYSFDGEESMWSPESLSTLTVGAITLDKTTEEKDLNWYTPQNIPVKKGDRYGKLVQNDVCWVALAVDEKTFKALSIKLETAKLAQKEAVIPIEIHGVKDRLPLILISVNDLKDENGNALVIGKLTRGVEQTMELRKTEVSVVLQSLKGLKVPKKSLFGLNTVDNTADMMLMVANRASLRRVKLLGTQDSWAVIENIPQEDMNRRVKVYDLYLQNPDGIMDGQVIQD